MTRPPGGKEQWRGGVFEPRIVHLLDLDAPAHGRGERRWQATRCGRRAWLHAAETADTMRCPDCVRLADQTVG